MTFEQVIAEQSETGPIFTVGTVEMLRADPDNFSAYDPVFLDELTALSNTPQVWTRAVEPEEANGLVPGWLWVMYSDASGLYMRVLTDAALGWATAPQEEVNGLGRFILMGLHQPSLKVLSPLGMVGHA